MRSGCGDSALYEHDLLRWLDARGIGYARLAASADLGGRRGAARSAAMGRALVAALRALPEAAWRPEGEDGDAVRHWAEVAYVPSDGVMAKDRPGPPRYLACAACS